MKRRIKHLSLIGASLVLALLVLDGQANAGNVWGCKVDAVFSDGDRLKVTCAGVAYYTNPGGGCHTADMDTVKSLQSLATAAFLAGKLLNISFEFTQDVCDNNAIWSLEMYNP